MASGIFLRDLRMVVDSVNRVIDSLRDTPILRPEQFAEVENRLALQSPEPKELLARLIHLQWLTHYQAKKIYNGRTAELLLGPYVILDKVGEGGMGRVFKAWQVRMSRVVALKVVRNSLLTNETVQRRFRREAKAAAQLAHPNIVRLFDADQADERFYLAMEFVEGTDLAALIKTNGPLAVPAACSFMRQAALGLQHAHEKGLVHRDIKPSNLLVTIDSTTSGEGTGSGGVIKILDMGLARVVEDPSAEELTALTQAGTVVGTPDYMSPEQGKNSSSVDARSDLYSLGCTFYFLLTGQPPFPKGTTLEKLLQHQMDPPPALEDCRPSSLPPVPEEVIDIIGRLLAKNPVDRFHSGEELAVELEPWCVWDPSTRNALPLLPTPSSAGTEEVFNFDDFEPNAGPRTAKLRPKIEPLPATQAEETTTQRRLRPYYLPIGIFVVVAIAIGLTIWKFRSKQPSHSSPSTPDEQPLVKDDPKQVPKKDKDPVPPIVKKAEMEAIDGYLPYDTSIVMTLNISQLTRSRCFREEMLPQINPTLRLVQDTFSIDPLNTLERLHIVLAVNAEKWKEPLLLLQGQHLLSDELLKAARKAWKVQETEEVVGREKVRVFEILLEADQAPVYAVAVHLQNGQTTTLAVSSNRDRVLDTVRRKNTPVAAKKDRFADPTVNFLLARRRDFNSVIWIGMGGNTVLPNTVVDVKKRGIDMAMLNLRLEDDLTFDLMIHAASGDHVDALKFYGNIATFFQTAALTDVKNTGLRQLGKLFADFTPKPFKRPKDDKPSAIHATHTVKRKDVVGWLTPFFQDVKKD